MKIIFLILFINISLLANFIEIHSFSADFKQIIRDEKNKKLVYTGSLQAKEPQSALWLYKTPVKKSIYIQKNRVIVIEPELEQVIVKHIPANFDFFHMIQNAKEVKKNMYVATIDAKEYTIIISKGVVSSISYADDFGNSIQILFSKQSQNTKIDDTIFHPIIPSDYDIIQ